MIKNKNKNLSKEEYGRTAEILLALQEENALLADKGYGPFLAAIYDGEGHLVAKGANSVSKEKCCLNHAEINAIREAHKKLKTYDLAPYNLSIYVTAEPCAMCMGAIMWSGIKRVFYGVSSADVEAITGFDEGFKPGWLEAFARRGIEVYGEIESESGKKVLKEYMRKGKEVYKPSRGGKNADASAKGAAHKR